MSYKIETFYLDCPLTVGRAFDVFTPNEIRSDVAVFIVHGGAWRKGSKNGLHKIAEAFALSGHVVASTDYRLYAKDAFVQLVDVREAYDRFAKLLSSRGRPQRIAVYGESAGAHLASLAAYANPGECGEDYKNESWVKPAMAILQATPVDFSVFEGEDPQFWSVMQDVAGAPYDEDPERYERLSLKSYVREDNPPTFFVEAEYEKLFPSAHTKNIAKMHTGWGISTVWRVYAEAEHGFIYELTRESQKSAFNDILKFIGGEPV